MARGLRTEDPPHEHVDLWIPIAPLIVDALLQDPQALRFGKLRCSTVETARHASGHVSLLRKLLMDPHPVPRKNVFLEDPI